MAALTCIDWTEIPSHYGIDESAPGVILTGMHSHNGAHLPTQPTIKQTAAFFGVDEKTIRRWISQRRLTAYRIGPRLIRVDRESILKLASPIGAAV